jgi:hypothetical protein
MSPKSKHPRLLLNPKNVKKMDLDEIVAALRGADDAAGKDGRELLARLLKGTRDRKMSERGLDESPVFGYYQELSEADILARVDWLILNDYLALEFDGRSAQLAFTPRGWAIEKETYARELLFEFDEMLAKGKIDTDMTYLKDKNREVIDLLLDKIKQSGDKKYLPILEAWQPFEDKKVRGRIQQAIDAIQQSA